MSDPPNPDDYLPRYIQEALDEETRSRAVKFDIPGENDQLAVTFETREDRRIYFVVLAPHFAWDGGYGPYRMLGRPYRVTRVVTD